MDETTRALLKKNNVSMGKKVTPAKYDNYDCVKEDPVLKRIRKKEKKNRRYKVVCLTLISLFLFCLGIPVIILGEIHDIQDLLILGPFFTISGVLFIIAMVVVLIRAKINAKRRVKPKKKRTKIWTNVEIPQGHILRQKTPSDVALYGGDIIHVPDIGSVPETSLPSPPPVYIPNDVMDVNTPTIRLPMEETKVAEKSDNDGKPWNEMESAPETSSAPTDCNISNPTLYLPVEEEKLCITSHDEKPVIGLI